MSILQGLKEDWWLVPAIILLLVSQFDWDYSYYQFLRVLVSFSGAFLAMRYLDNENASTRKFLYIAVALIFNPFLPVHLDRDLWAIIDFATAALFIKELFGTKRDIVS